MTAVALVLASPSLAARLQSLTQQAVDAWALRWGIAPVRVAASLEPAGASTDGSWLADSAAQPSARMLWPRKMQLAIARLLYGDGACAPAANDEHSLAAQSIRHVCDELKRALSQAWSVGEWRACAAPSELSRWEAPIHLQVTVGDATLVAVAPGGRFQATARAAPTGRPADLRLAFGDLPTRLSVVVGEVELSMADLAGLQPGDVLVLNSALTDPVHLQVDGCSASLSGHLGRQGPQRAVQLIPTSTS